MMEEVFIEPDFPLEEYRSRYDRARSLMDQKGIDALLLSLGIHLRYLAGYRTPFWGDAPGMPLALIPRDKAIAPILILGRYSEYTARTSWIDNVEYVSPGRPAPYNDACDLAVDYLRSNGLADGFIGMDIGNAVTDNMPTVVFDRIRSGLPGSSVVDAGQVMSPLRQIKSAAEIEAIRSACHTTCRAWQAGLEGLKEGMSEKELATILCSKVMDVGEEAGLFRSWIIYMASGQDMAVWCNVSPSKYRVQNGDLVLIDGGCLRKGYHCDMIRWGSVGEPSDNDRYLLETATEATAACKAVIKAGVTCGQVYQAGADVFRKSRIDQDLWQVWAPAGHGLGLEVHEEPFLVADSETPLQPGMVITVEPLIVKMVGGRFSNDLSLQYTGKAPDMMVVEDDVVVTESGYDLLTPLQPYYWVA